MDGKNYPWRNTIRSWGVDKSYSRLKGEKNGGTEGGTDGLSVEDEGNDY